ncbi:DUF1660 family phage protein [Dyella sp. C9]
MNGKQWLGRLACRLFKHKWRRPEPGRRECARCGRVEERTWRYG